MKALWLSRHALTWDQADSLPVPALGAEIVSVNMTLPAASHDAMMLIDATMREHGASVVPGVIPAHVAAAIARRAVRHRRCSRVFVPVAVPYAATEDGKPRPFAHSHWEEL